MKEKQILFKIITTFALFLSESDDDILDEDEAMKQLELLVASMRDLPQSTQREYLRFLYEYKREVSASLADGVDSLMESLDENFG